MFDVMKYAADHQVEVDVRPGTLPVVWLSASTTLICIWKSAVTQ